ncbi:MAG: sigma-54-dependent transcriptional regulator [Gemmataceae bacterium]
MSMSHILVVDDEEAVCWALERALRKEGHEVAVAATAEQALEQARKQRPDAVVLDVCLPGMDGLTALGELRTLTRNAPVIVITAFGNLDTAVRAVEGGAFEYLAKPFDLNQALELVARAVQRGAVTNQEQEKASGPSAASGEIVGRSLPMQTVFKRIALVAPRDDTCVLITGESGSGKEMVARAVHRHSPRREGPFLPVHVASLNPSLVESELFGHVKGAFTGAGETRPGLLQLAEGGTVFFDELADIPLPVQVKLLRVLEHNEVLPVGSNQPQPLNIRILSATHQDLQRKVAEGSFRHDLYFRLNVFQVHLPPLRERIEDLVPLAEHFLKRFEPRALPLVSDTVKYLTSLPWMGNVRELRNALEHAAIVARGGPLLPEHFPALISQVSPTGSMDSLGQSLRYWVQERIKQSQPEPPTDLYADMLKQVEPVLLEEVMRRLQGNRWVAAQWLGLNRATVRKKLGLYNLAGKEGKEEEDEES